MLCLPPRLVLLVNQETEEISSSHLNLSWGSIVLPNFMAGKDGTTNPDQTCHYCKDTGHLVENCVQLEARNEFLAEKEKKEKEGLN